VTYHWYITNICYVHIVGIEGKSICAFDKELMRIFVLSADGTYLVCNFEDGDECVRLMKAKFVSSPTTEMDDANGGMESPSLDNKLMTPSGVSQPSSNGGGNSG
jgi:hypothetical protein